ncbi:LysE family translocator [Vibrio sp.]|uniref:LysE family translocator n=1 Tax=Vibrio viridaestus TaxID=2487322 RepID=A0A3N9TKX5_9VIBR|nr:LysE family translocator [Vibrio viridaestus]MDC0609437.1 LysE family translocator [Vibrio sp.]RQW64771.1 LysE family translocator [Vibrio viridaestus]
MESSTLWVFIPTFFFVSATPGMCMTLALTLGMTIGVKRAMLMMVGELIGVGLVATLAIIGVAAILLNHPTLFIILKSVGALYLLYLGIQMWRSKGRLAIPENLDEAVKADFKTLASQGFITAIANPKGWAFFIALLPPFIHSEAPLPAQCVSLISVILVLEFTCLMMYACGGQTLRKALLNRGNVVVMNRISGSLMAGVAAWLALG